MAEPDGAAGVVAAQALVAVCAVLRLILEGWADRLTAAVDTAARTCHDFHEIIVAFAAFHRLNEASGLSEAAECCTVQFHALDIDLQFLKGTDLAQNLSGLCSSISGFSPVTVW